MAQESAISWTDSTFNPWIGCTKVGPACDGCYAEALMGEGGRFNRVVWGKPGQRGTLSRTAPSNWRQPRKWNREQAAKWAAYYEVVDAGGQADPPAPHFVFCASLADVFDNDAPLEWRQDLFALIRETPFLTYLLLTKRPQMIERLWFKSDGSNPWPKNAAIGFTAINQPEMDRDAPHALAAYRALNPAFLFWSGEPLLGPVVLPDELLALRDRFWAITGGETDQGEHKARPQRADWYRGPRDQCATAGAPYHHKQNGEWMDAGQLPIGDTRRNAERAILDGVAVYKCGKALSGRLLDGVEHNARPAA